ncbi:siderophore iron transporter [Fusarium beomiforme]|uniref:Siderophore iron transporter n=1 Tax=Fusarium beomiforme TaxID=44412 RepID=A0A9P5AGM3_9HYPO|nr:siderophore iron transporter [Fusarium beomiforme]
MTSNNATETLETLQKTDVSSCKDMGREQNQDVMHLENIATNDTLNIHYDEVDEEPELHMRTYIAIAAVWLMNLAQTIAVQGPPAVITYIGRSLNNTDAEAWVPNACTLVQAVLAPILCSASDLFQVRKYILIATGIIALIGCAIAPGSYTINRLIAAQALIGVGPASLPLVYVIPSEILPRKWRPVAQAGINVASIIAACAGPVALGGFIKINTQRGWVNFYWLQLGLWGLAVLGIFFGYKPPKRHSRYDHLSFWQKMLKLDITGSFLLASGLSLFLTGLNLGGGLYSWQNARTLCTLVIGLVILVVFGLFEWKGTKSPLVDHGLFKGGKNQGRTFALCMALICIEGVMLFAVAVFYNVQSAAIYATDPLKVVARVVPWPLMACVGTFIFGFWSTKLRTIRSPMAASFLVWTGGLVGLATLQPSDGLRQIIFVSLAGLGFGGPLVLILAGVQLAVPHKLIGTSSALTTSVRALAGTVFIAIYSTALNARLKVNLPNQIAPVVLKLGLPSSSIGAFITALGAGDMDAVAKIPGVTPEIISAGLKAFKQAFADSIRVMYIIAAPFGLAAIGLSFFLGSMRETMNYAVDAPIEELHAKHRHTDAEHVA